MHRSNLILLIIILCAGILRFWGLDYSSLWTDELASWMLSSQHTLSDVIQGVRHNEIQPPLYFALLHYVITYLGDTEWMLRMLSAIFGTASVYAIYLLGKNLYTSREGLTAAAIMAVSWAPIFYSQEARSYILLLFLSIILFYYWLKLIRAFEAVKTPSAGTFSGFVLASIFASYTHYFGLQLVILQMLGFVVLFIHRPKILAKVVFLYGLIFLAYLPWLPNMLAQMNARTSFWAPELTFLQSLASFINFSYHMDWWIVAVLVVPPYAYAVIDGIRAIKEEKQLRKARAILFSSGGLLLLWVTLPFLAAFVQSMISTPIMVDRYLIILLPAVYILLARGITAMSKPFARTWTGVLLLVLLATLVFDDHYYSKPQKDQYREAAAYVVQNQGGYKDFPVVAHAWDEYFFDYYFERFGSPAKVGLLAGSMDDLEVLKNFLQARNAQGFWFLTGQRIPEQQFIEQLDNSYELATKVELNGASASLYLVRN